MSLSNSGNLNHEAAIASGISQAGVSCEVRALLSRGDYLALQDVSCDIHAETLRLDGA